MLGDFSRIVIFSYILRVSLLAHSEWRFLFWPAAQFKDEEDDKYTTTSTMKKITTKTVNKFLKKSSVLPFAHLERLSDLLFVGFLFSICPALSQAESWY